MPEAFQNERAPRGALRSEGREYGHDGPSASFHEEGGARLVRDAMVTSPKTVPLEAGLAGLHAFFEDDHVLMALVVAPDGRLLTTVERHELQVAGPGLPLGELGALSGRTVDPGEPLGPVTERLKSQRRRRLAVVDSSGRLLGLLCLKRDGTGYCSDDGVRARAEERNSVSRDAPSRGADSSPA